MTRTVKLRLKKGEAKTRRTSQLMTRTAKLRLKKAKARKTNQLMTRTARRMLMKPQQLMIRIRNLMQRKGISVEVQRKEKRLQKNFEGLAPLLDLKTTLHICTHDSFLRKDVLLHCVALVQSKKVNTTLLRIYNTTAYRISSISQNESAKK